jgi:hypothetical protein
MLVKRGEMPCGLNIRAVAFAFEVGHWRINFTGASSAGRATTP